MDAANRAPSGGSIQQISDKKRRKAMVAEGPRKAMQKGTPEKRRVACTPASPPRRTIHPPSVIWLARYPTGQPNRPTVDVAVRSPADRRRAESEHVDARLEEVPIRQSFVARVGWIARSLQEGKESNTICMEAWCPERHTAIIRRMIVPNAESFVLGV